LEPGPGKYRLYAAVPGDPDGWIAVIDCATDSVIDTLRYGFQRTPGVVASPDGRYLGVIGSGRPPLIWDVASRAPIGYFSAPTLFPTFLPEARLVIGTPYESTLVFSLPSLTPMDAWPVELVDAQRVPGRSWVMGAEHRGYPPPGDDWSKLAVYDYAEGREIDSVIISPDEQGVGFQVSNFCLSPDGRRLYALGGGAGGGPSLVGYDLGHRQLLFRQQLYSAVGNCRVTPNGREVWITDPGSGFESPIFPGLILIFDAATGTVLDTITTVGYPPRPTQPLYVQDIRFTPTGEKAYVNCIKWGTPILVIDTQTRQITKLIFGGSRNMAGWIDVAPVP
jgi:WD40 repeat protein